MALFLDGSHRCATKFSMKGSKMIRMLSRYGNLIMLNKFTKFIKY